MKLVNVLKRQKYKKELHSQIREVAPELLGSEQKELKTFQKLNDIGLVEKEEKVYMDMKQEAKKICLLLEHIYKLNGMDVMVAINFLDYEDKEPGTIGRIVHLSGPHMPDEYAEFSENFHLTPFSCVCGKAAFKNQIVFTADAQNDPVSSDELRAFYERYGVQGTCSFPINSMEGEVIGTVMVVCCHPPVLSDEELEKFHEQITNILVDLEYTFTLLQEKWRSRNVISWRYWLSDDLYVIYADPDVEEGLGYSVPDVMGKELFENYIHPEDIPRMKTLLEDVIQNRVTKRSVLRVKKKDGTYQVVDTFFLYNEQDNRVDAFASINTKDCLEFEAQQVSKRLKVPRGLALAIMGAPLLDGFFPLAGKLLNLT